MANTARKNIKRATRNKRRQAQRVARVQKSIDSIDYASYLSKARRELPQNQILSYPEYLTAREGQRARGNQISPVQLVQRQVQGGYSDKEIDARLKAHRRLWPEQNLTRGEFIRNRAWEDFNEVEKVMKAKYIAEGMSEEAAKAIVWRGIMSPELKGEHGE